MVLVDRVVRFGLLYSAGGINGLDGSDVLVHADAAPTCCNRPVSGDRPVQQPVKLAALVPASDQLLEHGEPAPRGQRRACSDHVIARVPILGRDGARGAKLIEATAVGVIAHPDFVWRALQEDGLLVLVERYFLHYVVLFCSIDVSRVEQ